MSSVQSTLEHNMETEVEGPSNKNDIGPNLPSKAALELSKEEVLNLRKQHVGFNVALNYASNPVMFVRGQGTYLYDENGVEYLDGVNNVCHVGHSHPEVVDALTKQITTLNTNSRFLHPELSSYAKELISTFKCNKGNHETSSFRPVEEPSYEYDANDSGDDPFPVSRASPVAPEGTEYHDLSKYNLERGGPTVDDHRLSVVFFVNSGSEANDLALRLARTYTGNHDAIVIGGAYHGHLSSTIELSPYKFEKIPDHKQADWVHVAAGPDVHRGCFQGSIGSKKLGKAYAREVEAILKKNDTNGRGFAAFYCESMVSCGGQYALPSGYLRSVYRSVRENGGVCIADEVQVGFGRVGDDYWAFEDHRVVPDIVTMGKPMGNGHPIAAVVTSPAVARAFNNGVSYFNTFGGNPVACAAGRAVLRILRQEDLIPCAKRIGSLLCRELGAIKDEFPQVIGDVRGRGLFVGMELLCGSVRGTDNRKRVSVSELPLDSSCREFKEIVTSLRTGEVELMDECGNEILIPFKPLTEWISMRMMQAHHVLISVDGPDNNILKMKPPLSFGEKEVVQVATALKECLTTATTQGLVVEGHRNVLTLDECRALATEEYLRSLLPHRRVHKWWSGQVTCS
eukprot:gb/GECG01011498.1/.p1 GENE.gb/GECG01011498.1/~~gb/GECG01011498.1/.p1  ORF type:complete len:626 (+),score=58.53 gb/GECG01011498.1/:1-1878(+)